jgi:hypothetical protein
MALEGHRNFTSFTGTNWTTPGNAAASDNAYASFNGTTQDFLHCETAGFAIPDNSIIRGFEVSIEGNGDGGTAAERTIEVFLTKNGTASVGTGKTLELNLTSDTTQVLGTSTDLWGAVWDIAEVNATTFGVFIRDNNVTAANLDIDHVTIRVYYDFGIRGEWDVDYDDLEVTHIDGYLDYDGGSGGTAPADEDVVRDATTGRLGKVVVVSNASTLAFGTLGLTGVHSGTTFTDNNTLDVLSFVLFDTETNGGISEDDIGQTFDVTGGGTVTGGVIRHIESDGINGKLWYTATSATIVDNDVINVPAAGTARASANGTHNDNAWTGLVNGSLITTSQGTLDYDGETVTFESSTGSGRIRSSDFQHNLVIHDATSNATALVVDDREDPNATDTGRFFLIDISGTFGDNNTVNALEELDYDTEANGGFAIGDTVTGLTSTETGVVRRLIDNGVSGTLYLSAVTGPFTDGEALQVSATTRGNAVTLDAHRRRVGTALVNGTLTTTDVQWNSSHLYTDLQDQVDELLSLDDKIPMSAQVRDQQYTNTNSWEIPFHSTRRLKKGGVNMLAAVGGADNDAAFTNDFHLGSLNTSNGVPNLYVDQNATILEQFWDAGSMDVLVRNKNKNLLVDSGRRTWYARPWNDLWDFFEISAVGLRNPIPLNTSNDLNNTTSEATINSTQLYHDIRIMFASHTVAFDTGTGTMAIGDVVHNTTTNTTGQVCRVPTSLVSGSDLHLASNGVDLTAWGDNQTLDLLDAHDFDGQVSQFIIGEAVENQTDTWNATVRFVQQYGATRGRIWVSNVTGTLADNDTIRLDGAGATRATANGAVVTAGTWTALTNGATPVTADTTVLKDIGQGGDQPYNAVVDLNGASVLQMYEMLKFVSREAAGSTTDAGSVLYPNNTSRGGRTYQKADSAYGAADLVKQAPFGTFAGGKFFGARGIFIEDMIAADAQAYQLIDANGVTRTPPNIQSVTVSNLAVGGRVAVFRRSETTDSFTYADANPDTITRSTGDFVDEGFVPDSQITVTGTVSNNGTFTIATVSALTITLIATDTLVAEGPVSSTITGANIDKDQFTGAATGNNSGDPDFVVQETLPVDLPSSGTIKIVHVNGSETASGGYEFDLAYTSYTGSTFTLSGTLPQAFDANARVYVPLIYKTAASASESQSITFSAAFPTKTVYRKKGELPFESDGTFGANGQSVTVVRATDTIVE